MCRDLLCVCGAALAYAAVASPFSLVHRNCAPNGCLGRQVAVRRVLPRVRISGAVCTPGHMPAIVLGASRALLPDASLCACCSVLNTDNMSILGDTIDYGPFGFMDAFDSSFVCNASDNGARYSYENQPKMCRWNCERLFDMFQPVLPKSTDKQSVLNASFDASYKKAYDDGMRRKVRCVVFVVHPWRRR